MSTLPDLLERAAGGAPVGFDHTDVRRRVRRRARRQRAALAGAAVLLAALVAGGLTVAGDDDESVRVDQPGGPITEAELTGGTWVLHAVSEVTTFRQSAWASFDEDGSLLVADGCTYFEGSWRLEGDRFEPVDLQPLLPQQPDDCGRSALGDLLAAGPRVGRPDDQPAALRLLAGDRWAGLRRVDRIGRTPSGADLGGEPWRLEGGPTELIFASDGTLHLGGDGGCGVGPTWALEGADLAIAPPDEDAGGGCATLVQSAFSGIFDGTTHPRLDGSTLYLVSPDGPVVALTRGPSVEEDAVVGREGEAAKDVAERVASDVLGEEGTTTAVDDTGDLDRVTLEMASGSTVVARVRPATATAPPTLVDLASPGLALDGPGSLVSPASGRARVTTYLDAVPGEIGFLAEGLPVVEGPNALALGGGGRWLQVAIRTEAGSVLHGLWELG